MSEERGRKELWTCAALAKLVPDDHVLPERNEEHHAYKPCYKPSKAIRDRMTRCCSLLEVLHREESACELAAKMFALTQRAPPYLLDTDCAAHRRS